MPVARHDASDKRGWVYPRLQWETPEQYVLFLKHLFAYEFASTFLRSTDKVLELGGGTGYGTSLISQRVQSIVALDVEAETAAEASAQYENAKCMFQVYDGKNIPYDDDTFHAVIAFQVLEHIEDVRRIVGEVHRVLKQGGILLTTTPNRTYRLSHGQKPWNPEHVREYYPREFFQLLKGVFPHTQVMGIRGKKTAQRIEHQRCRPEKKKSASFFMQKKDAMLETIKKRKDFLWKLLFPQNPAKGRTDFTRLHSTQDFFVIKRRLKRHSLDLLGLCQK
jgi:ubiquinone/menaquinone biosynthesis C-methylase UbiE